MKNNKESIAVSKFLWEQEKEAIDRTNTKHVELVEILDPLIDSGKVLYSDFVDLLIQKFYEKSKEYTEDSIEERKKLIDDIHNELIAYYKTI